MLNSSFYRFVFGFAAIIAVAFGVLFVVSSKPQGEATVDSVAHPR
jgi:hypothetical protein